MTQPLAQAQNNPSSADAKDLKDYIEKNNKIIINELFDLLKLKSISADPKYKNQVLKTAELISKILPFSSLQNTQRSLHLLDNSISMTTGVLPLVFNLKK